MSDMYNTYNIKAKSVHLRLLSVRLKNFLWISWTDFHWLFRSCFKYWDTRGPLQLFYFPVNKVYSILIISWQKDLRQNAFILILNKKLSFCSHHLKSNNLPFLFVDAYSKIISWEKLKYLFLGKRNPSNRTKLSEVHETRGQPTTATFADTRWAQASEIWTKGGPEVESAVRASDELSNLWRGHDRRNQSST